MNLHVEVLPQRSFQLLKEIARNEEFSDFYLGGGTSLAMQLGHRVSIDLDFFSPQPFSVSLLQSFPKPYTTNIARKNSIQIISENTKVEFMYWAFPITQPMQYVEEITLLHPIDIGLMKLLAIQGRTTKKDMIDLYVIDKHVITLESLVSLFIKEYPKESFNLYNCLKDFFNREALEIDPLPNLTITTSFEDMVTYLKAKIVKILKKEIGL